MRYAKEYHEEFLKLTIRCELVVQLSNENFIIPSMLPERDLGTDSNLAHLIQMMITN